MKLPQEEIFSILIPFNPWWKKEKIPDLPHWKRSVFNQLLDWIENPPAHRALMISGARQIGKTTLLLQVIEELIKKGIPPSNILYATFDHPILKLAGVEAVLQAWRELEPKKEGPEFLFLDEAQFIKEFGTWVKHNVDFAKHRKIVFTGSATPLSNPEEESGVGRWHTLQMSTLSFFEYLQIKKIKLPNIPKVNFLSDLFESSSGELFKISEANQILIGHFNEYLVRGGFPQTSLVESVAQAQKLLREDIIDKVLKRDMTALFGVRRIIELEQTFIYLCMHESGIQDLQTLSRNLGITKQTVQNFINLLESTHLLYKLAPYGYGKEILRARYKLYLSDPAIASAILMKGKTILEDAKALGSVVETAVFCHLKAHNLNNHARFSYWKDHKNKEIDLIYEFGDQVIPLEIKYQSQNVTHDDVPAMIHFFNQKGHLKHGYILTKSSQDIGLIESDYKILRLPAPIFCYWIGESEISQKNVFHQMS